MPKLEVSEPYHSRRLSAEMVVVRGFVEDFRMAGIDLEGAEFYRDDKKANLRGPVDEMGDIIDAANTWNEQEEERVRVDSIYDWMEKNKGPAKLLRKLIQEGTIGEKMPPRMVEAVVGLKTREAKAVWRLMYQDGWFDAKEHLTSDARTRIKEWRKMQKLLKTKG